MSLIWWLLLIFPVWPLLGAILLHWQYEESIADWTIPPALKLLVYYLWPLTTFLWLTSRARDRRSWPGWW